MGYWENTTYLHTADCDAVLYALDRLLTAEGMNKTRAPYRRRPREFEPMTHNDAMHNNLWGIAVFPGSEVDGAGGWCIVKTAPYELLAERAPDTTRPRVVRLAASMGLEAVQLHIYDSKDAILLETKAGKYRVTGSSGTEGGTFHDEEIASSELGFEIVKGHERLLYEQDHRRIARGFAREFGGHNAAFAENTTSAVALPMGQRIPAPGARVVYYEWPTGDRDEGEAGNVQGLRSRFTMR